MMDIEVMTQAAREFGSTTYVFDVDGFQQRLAACKDIVGSDIELCFAMKANPFLIGAAARAAQRLEVCSPGELALCMRSGIDPTQIVYSGVNKLPADIGQAIDYGCGVLTAESLLQARYIEQVAAQKGVVVDVLPRLNSGSQFGMSRHDLLSLVDNRGDYPHLNLVGIHYFVSTQRKNLKHQFKELDMLAQLLDELASQHGFEVHHLEYGPGLAVPYFVDDDFSDTLAPLRQLAPTLQELEKKVHVTVEMGRFFAAPCGCYLTQAMDLKSNEGVNYCIVDGGMNHLSYYGQMMGMRVPRIENLTSHLREPSQGGEQTWCLCGSICSVNDVLVREVQLQDLQVGDILAFQNAGAYAVTEGVALFLSRTLPCVVFYENGQLKLVRDFVESYHLNDASMA